jgi:GntR family transcriptional regulator
MRAVPVFAAKKTMRNRNAEPVYKQIQKAIRQRIDSGKLRPGNAVPSERELARLHKVSLMTARHALSEMARDGIVERRHGAGTFVAGPRVQFNKLLSYTEHMASLGLTTNSRVVTRETALREHEIAARLGLAPTALLGKLERVRLAGDESVALETCYWSAEEYPNLVDAPLERVSLFGVMEREFGVELAYSDEEIDATDADLRLADLLAITCGSPLLRIRQLIFSTKSRATVYVVGFYRSGRHTLRVRRFR